MKYFKIVFATAFLFVSQLTLAGDQLGNKIEFNMPEKFTDFSSDINRSSKDRAMLIKKLTELMNKSLSETSKNRFEITVNDIDMAGRFIQSNTEFVRVVNDFDRTRFEFAYKMYDSNGKIVDQGDINLSNRNPHDLKSRSNKYKNSIFGNEMRMFDEWLASM